MSLSLNEFDRADLPELLDFTDGRQLNGAMHWSMLSAYFKPIPCLTVDCAKSACKKCVGGVNLSRQRYLISIVAGPSGGRSWFNGKFSGLFETAWALTVAAGVVPQAPS
ncbi:hypothetical protein [Herbaspirillum lusitanum]|uniref:hypothetical protein n=1 Tax=Herbaspirillum lusitanum TaxID=213312 RepID=UPI002238CA81|nr:hypothetical protein [Herbaspirillum lusitanum]